MDDLISVIIPVFKVEDYIDECIISVINQSYKHIEIILVDDGSPDKCPELCDLWATKDNRIKVVHKCNGGLSSARNAGLDIACGDGRNTIYLSKLGYDVKAIDFSSEALNRLNDIHKKL